MAKIEVTGYVKRVKQTRNNSTYFQVAERQREKNPQGEWVNAGSTYYSVFLFDAPDWLVDDELVTVYGRFRVQDDEYTNREGAVVPTKRLIINGDMVEKFQRPQRAGPYADTAVNTTLSDNAPF